jgi:hypothetical protein
MSIIIGLITRNNQLFLTSDKRAIHSNGFVNDNYKKLLQLRPKLYFGMTGIAEYGLLIYEKVRKLPNFNEMSVQDIINSFNKYHKQMVIDSTIMVAGIMEDSEAFIWSKNTRGEARFIKRDKQSLMYSINTNNNVDKFESRFREEIIKSEGFFVTAMRNTIEYASTIDHTISNDYDLILI